MCTKHETRSQGNKSPTCNLKSVGIGLTAPCGRGYMRTVQPRPASQTLAISHRSMQPGAMNGIGSMQHDSRRFHRSKGQLLAVESQQRKVLPNTGKRVFRGCAVSKGRPGAMVGCWWVGSGGSGGCLNGWVLTAPPTMDCCHPPPTTHPYTTAMRCVCAMHAQRML